jgi:outer membrane lipoprotein-sorting protein
LRNHRAEHGLRRSCAFTVTGVALVACAICATMSAAADDIFARSRAMYASLLSYADTGTVDKQYGQGGASHDRHTFTTYFKRAPRGYYFEFSKLGGVDRYVIWGDPQAFHTWWKTTVVKTDYPNPNNTGAFTGAGEQTAGSAMQITPLLYAKAQLPGALANFTNIRPSGTEEINGRPCYRLVGTTSESYAATGRVVNARDLTVWIDTESLLVRKVYEKPKDQVAGWLSSVTTTFVPQANPAIDNSRFRFTPPK